MHPPGCATGTLITMGWLTGRIGPRTLLLAALVLYGIGSALAAFAPTAEAFLGGLWLFPDASERTTDRIDITSVVVSIAAVMLTVFGLQEIADQGLSRTYVLSVAGGVVLGWWFIRRQRRIDNPLLDLSLFAYRVLRILMVFFLLSPLAFMAADFILIQHLQIVVGISTGTLGLVLAVPGVASIAATALTPVLTARFAPATVMTVGTGTGVLGLLVILIAVTTHPVTWLFAVGMTIAALGAGPPMVLGAQLVLTSVSKMQTGPVSAIQDISASLGSAIGIMVLGSLSAAVFRRGVNSGAPEAVSEADLDAATDSPGAAAAIAGEVGGSTGEQLLSVVHDAWSWGTVATYAAAVFIGVLLMVVIGRGLRGIRLPSDEEADGEDAHLEDPHRGDTAVKDGGVEAPRPEQAGPGSGQP